MNVPQYWSKAAVEDTDQRGRPVRFSCWRSSDASEQAAHESATSAAKRALAKLVQGEPLDRYGYGTLPLREEVIERIADGEGSEIAAITRNAYGAMILNAARVMFVDIDFPPLSAGEAVRRFFGRLLGRPAGASQQAREDKARQIVEAFAAANPGWRFRLYRTAAGLRLGAMHDLFEPAASATLETLDRLGCDPLYIRLCKAQECFRARLTPKPWRCGMRDKSPRYPTEDAEHADRLERWKAEYEARRRDYATCRFLATLGGDRLHPEAVRILEIHDQFTRCHESLPLA